MSIYERLMHADPDQLAAIAHAAACWETLMASPYGQEIAGELAAWQHRSVMSEWSSAVAVMIKGHDYGPTQDQLVTHRNQLGRACLEFIQRHGGPYRGGPVDWLTGRSCHQAKPCAA